MFTHKHNPPQSDSVCRQHVVRLPRGLESCRYGGTVGVTFSELGPDSNGDRSSMPSEAMSLTVTDDGQRRRERLLAAPSLQSARRSSRRWFAGAVLLPVQQPRWRQPGRGGAARWSPPLTDMTRSELWTHVELNTAHTVLEFVRKTCQEIDFNCLVSRICLIKCNMYRSYINVLLRFQTSRWNVSVLDKHRAKSTQLRFLIFATRCHFRITENNVFI